MLEPACVRDNSGKFHIQVTYKKKENTLYTAALIQVNENSTNFVFCTNMEIYKIIFCTGFMILFIINIYFYLNKYIIFINRTNF